MSIRRWLVHLYQHSGMISTSFKPWETNNDKHGTHKSGITTVPKFDRSYSSPEPWSRQKELRIENFEEPPVCLGFDSVRGSPALIERWRCRSSIERETTKLHIDVKIGSEFAFWGDCWSLQFSGAVTLLISQSKHSHRSCSMTCTFRSQNCQPHAFFLVRPSVTTKDYLLRTFCSISSTKCPLTAFPLRWIHSFITLKHDAWRSQTRRADSSLIGHHPWTVYELGLQGGTLGSLTEKPTW